MSDPGFATRNERAAARPNPFANFGRFGVDGGLEGAPGTVSLAAAGAKSLEAAGKRTGRDGAPHLHGGSIEKAKGSRDWDERRAGDAVPAAASKFGSPPNVYSTNERGARRGESAAAPRETLANGRERREEKKEGRAEEGGWRTAGGKFPPRSVVLGSPLDSI